MTPLTAAERQVMRERHRRVPRLRAKVRVDVCKACGTEYLCDAAVLLDALDAAEKELDEARGVVETALDRMAEFDPSDNYHNGDISEPGYYAAISRCSRLLRGEITDWMSPQPAAPVATAETCGHTEHRDCTICGVREGRSEGRSDYFGWVPCPDPAAGSSEDER